eukprot:14284821-Alexandrium_andersonii.AAC.1
MHRMHRVPSGIERVKPAKTGAALRMSIAPCSMPLDHELSARARGNVRVLSKQARRARARV